MSRRLDADHERMFAVFAGDDAAAAEAHREFRSWLASNDLSGSLLSSSTERAASALRSSTLAEPSGTKVPLVPPPPADAEQVAAAPAPSAGDSPAPQASPTADSAAKV